MRRGPNGPWSSGVRPSSDGPSSAAVVRGSLRRDGSLGGDGRQQVGERLGPVRRGLPDDPPVQQPPADLLGGVEVAPGDRGDRAPVGLRVALREALERGPVAGGVLGRGEVMRADDPFPPGEAGPQGVVQEGHREQQTDLGGGEVEIGREPIDQPGEPVGHPAGEVEVLPRVVGRAGTVPRGGPRSRAPEARPPSGASRSRSGGIGDPLPQRMLRHGADPAIQLVSGRRPDHGGHVHPQKHTDRWQ